MTKHGTSGSAARAVLVSRASRSALASYRKVTTCRCLCCAYRGCNISADNLCLTDDLASRPQGRVLVPRQLSDTADNGGRA